MIYTKTKNLNNKHKVEQNNKINNQLSHHATIYHPAIKQTNPVFLVEKTQTGILSDTFTEEIVKHMDFSLKYFPNSPQHLQSSSIQFFNQFINYNYFLK